MKAIIFAVAVFFGVHAANASHTRTRTCSISGTVVYTHPVVYMAPVVYTAPVVYHSPVYHAGNPAYNQVVYTPTCQSPNVIIAGRGAYRTSYQTSPTVMVIGSGHASRGMLPGRRYR